MAKYSVEQILSHAMEIEESGQKFYVILADRLDDARLKKIFTIMARQDIGHFETCKKIRDRLPASPDAPPAESELFDCRKHEFLEDKIFNRLDVVRKTPKINTPGDALAFMIDN